MPKQETPDRDLLSRFEDLKEVITTIRSIRKDKDIPPKKGLKLLVRTAANGSYHPGLESVILKLANLTDVETVSDDPGHAVSFIVKNVEYFLPVGDLVNPEEEIEKLVAELEYTRGFCKSVEKKLSNERLVQNAPEAVVEKEQQKMADAEVKIGVLESQIEKLRSR